MAAAPPAPRASALTDAPSASYGGLTSGIDTVSIGWALRPSARRHWRASDIDERIIGDTLYGFHRLTGGLDWRCPLARVRPAAGGLMRFLPLDGRWPSGWTLGMFRRNGLTVVEGRATAIVGQKAEIAELGRPEALGTVARVGAQGLRRLGLMSGLREDDAYIRRLDLATEVRFAVGADGLAFLDALGRVHAARLKTDIWRHHGRPETVAFRTPSTRLVRLRVYDKGVEQRSDPPGERIRIERQCRFQSSTAPGLGSHFDLASLFGQPLATVIAKTQTLTITTPEDAAAILIDRALSGEMSAVKAELLIGTVEIQRRLGIASGYWSDRTAERRQAELDALGLVVDPQQEHRRTVPVGSILTDAVSQWLGRRPSARA